MGLRFLMSSLLIGSFLAVYTAEATRYRRQADGRGQTSETFYQPPILLGSPQVLQNSYQPPLLKPRSIPSASQPLDSASSGYVLPYAVPHNPPKESLQSFHHGHPSSISEAVAQSVPVASSNGPSGLSAERTYSTHSNAVGSAIHKAPASEIESSKESIAKEKAAANAKDEYVVYYYYYYDNDTTPNSNLSLNFDDIPSLEGYDDSKDAEKITTNLGNNGNALTVDDRNSSSQARSVSGSEAVIRADRPVAQPLKPVSNVFRYGSNEVPRFPVLPNFVVSEVTTTTQESLTLQSFTSEAPTTTVSSQFANPHLNEDTEDDTLNNVLDSTSEQKASDAKAAEETTTTTTTTEPTTTEAETTTTEKPRRRPSIGGGRRRFNSNPSSSPSSFSSNRSRPPTRSTTSTSSSTSTTTTSTPTRRSFQGSRLRPRPPLSGSRSSSRTTESTEDRPASPAASESTTASTTTARSRFSSASPRRFQSSRSRSQTSSTTTTRSPVGPTPSRSRTTSRPRPNLISRNRPARPGFLRPRPGSEPEEPETTTPEPVEETSPSGAANEVISLTTDEEEEESEETETEEEPTTTESSRFSALFRPRNRNALGNRPRPAIGNRPGRS